MDNQRLCFIFSNQRNYTESRFPAAPEGKEPVPMLFLRKPHSSAFVDLNNDLTAGLLELESVMGLRMRQGNLRIVFRLFSLMGGLLSIRLK